MEAWKSRGEGTGVIVVNGRLVEELHVKEVCGCRTEIVLSLFLSPTFCRPHLARFAGTDYAGCNRQAEGIKDEMYRKVK